MNQSIRKNRLYFIIGCTACGKGAVGCALARRIGGQIISVDSMKIYRRMDVGTAKPSAQLRAEIPHHCIDLVEPSEGFSVAEYLACADASIHAVLAGSAIPLAVGGTSLYIKALTEGLFEDPSTDPRLRAELTRRAEDLGHQALHAELALVDPVSAERIHPNDLRRIVRALEVYRSTGRPISSLQRQWDAGARRYDCVFVGLRRDQADLHRRIVMRVRRMMQAGLAEEVARLLAEPAGLSSQAAQAVGYAEIIEHLRGGCSLDQAVEHIKINTRRLAKKQRTWHRRWRDVKWFDLPPDEQADQTARRILAEVRFE